MEAGGGVVRLARPEAVFLLIPCRSQSLEGGGSGGGARRWVRTVLDGEACEGG